VIQYLNNFQWIISSTESLKSADLCPEFTSAVLF